jgi:NADH-quinone oxidoreductase subunit L
LSVLMLLFVTGVGTLIHIYSLGYMKGDNGYGRFFCYLNLFMFSMLILVLGDSLPLMFVGWEGVGLCSYLLIGFWFEDPAKAAAGKKAFVVNRIGDFGVLLAMFLITWTLAREAAPSLAIADIKHHLDAFTPGIATTVCLLLFLGATGKSAQIPLYVWLPDAMAGPTPVSALIHAATMVTAGVYMVARLGFLFELSPLAMSIVALIGALTALLAATIAVAQNDFKKVLAYSTVSQLGYMFVGVGVGAFASGIFHVFTHAFFKACLFLCSGAVIHALHEEQDIRNMGGLRKVMPITFWTFVIATLALAGIPPFAGFFSKDHILWEALSTPNTVWPWLPRLLWVVLVVAAFLTAFYMWRLVSLVFLGKYRGPKEKLAHAHEAPFSMAMPLVVLATCSVLVGFLGVPPLLKGGNIIEHWLEPVVHAEHAAVTVPGEQVAGETPEFVLVSEAQHASDPDPATDEHTPDPQHGAVGHAEHSAAQEWLAMGIALTAGVLGLLLGSLFYWRRPQLSTQMAARLPGMQRLLENKYWVDEFYDAVIIRPIRVVSEGVLWRIVDVRIIDGIVNALGGLTKAFSYVFRFAQSGYVQTYVLVVVLGVLFLLVRAL